MLVANGNVAEFQRRAEAVVSGPSKVVHRWSDNGSRLVFPRSNDGGFDVEIWVSGQEIVVSALGAHEHFPFAAAAASDVCGAAFGLVRDLLSSDMRVREHRAGGKPFRWTVESRTDTGWRLEWEGGRLFFNYLARRSTCLYQNHQLPGRLLPEDGQGTSAADGASSSH